jgi:hypothetical protein
MVNVAQDACPFQPIRMSNHAGVVFAQMNIAVALYLRIALGKGGGAPTVERSPSWNRPR